VVRELDRFLATGSSNKRGSSYGGPTDAETAVRWDRKIDLVLLSNGMSRECSGVRPAPGSVFTAGSDSTRNPAQPTCSGPCRSLLSKFSSETGACGVVCPRRQPAPAPARSIVEGRRRYSDQQRAATVFNMIPMSWRWRHRGRHLPIATTRRRRSARRGIARTECWFIRSPVRAGGLGSGSPPVTSSGYRADRLHFSHYTSLFGAD